LFILVAVAQQAGSFENAQILWGENAQQWARAGPVVGERAAALAHGGWAQDDSRC